MPFNLKRDDLLIKEQKKDYVKSDGPVNHLDDSGLSREILLPRNRRIILIVFVVIGCIIGALIVYNVVFNAIGGAEREHATLEENLQRDVAPDLPILKDIIKLNNEDVQKTFDDLDYTTYVASDEEKSKDGSIDLLKIPSDLDLDTAISLYSEGVSSLSAADAVLFLKGSWTLNIDRSDSVSMRVRYADFSSSDIETAINSAIDTEGFNAKKASELADDDSGNAYREGKVKVGKTKYKWRVSACALKDVYDISGLPDTANYVGIRVWK